jgi:hypothetical protein
MRTTIDLPEELYRALKARAALNGMSMREVVAQLIVQGLRSPPLRERGRRPPPPIIVPPRGVSIPALSCEDKLRLEEAEDESKHARSARR